MKKQNLVVLLLIPFLVSFLGLITVYTAYQTVAKDITSIQWDYRDTEAYQMSGNPYLLEAKAEYDSSYRLAYGNQLVWSVENKDHKDFETHATIEKKGEDYYLKTQSVGDVLLTCSNEKGNVSRSFEAVIYQDAAILLSPEIPASQNNIDRTIYYGEYDLHNGVKTKAEFILHPTVLPEDVSSSLRLREKSPNVDYDFSSHKVSIYSPGKASLAFEVGSGVTTKYTFFVVPDGVNVYTYDELLDCTNRSQKGEIVCLRKNFLSLKNTYETKPDGSLVLEAGKPKKRRKNAELFGHYDFSSGSFSFSEDSYCFETTGNREFIDQWNDMAAKDSRFMPLSDQLRAALHIQKDFYGNGYQLDFHDLTYPSSLTQVIGPDGNTHQIPTLSSKDLFRGPLYTYSLGDSGNLPIIAIYGQDNSGLYVEGKDITINDVDVRNCDYGDSLSFLSTTGSVMDVLGENVTLKNSRLANGKNVLRVFSSMGVTVDNCLLSDGMNFLLDVGSNRQIKVNGTRQAEFVKEDGSKVRMSIDDFLSIDSQDETLGNGILNRYLQGEYSDPTKMAKALEGIQNGLNDKSLLSSLTDGDVTVKDTYFYRSGIASIGMESQFTGPFFYNCSPSYFLNILHLLNNVSSSTPLIPLIPKNISGMSYPVKVSLEGKTSFYDYKDIDSMDISGLIKENISTLVNAIGKDASQYHLNIDSVFPIRSLLKNAASKTSQIYRAQGQEDEMTKNYVNIPIAYYGGGINLSQVDTSLMEEKDHYKEPLQVDLVKSFLEGETQDSSSKIFQMLYRAVTVFTGFEPFRFVLSDHSGFHFGEAPKISSLKENSKGAMDL